MGYTQYWKFNRRPSEAEFSKAVKTIGTIFDEYLPKGIHLADGSGEENTRPVITDGLICFNGEGDDSYETFRISIDDEPGRQGFCKTARNKYDSAVCVCLLVFKDIMWDGFWFDSDGNLDDFVDSETGKAYQRSLGWTVAEWAFNMYLDSIGRHRITTGKWSKFAG